MVFYRDLKGQEWLFPPDIRDMIPDNHICHLVDMVMGGMDFNDLESSYEGPGHPAYHPKVMLKILIMATIDGIHSSRNIAKLARENVVYMYLAGLLKPDFRTISDFRKDHPEEVRRAFKEVVMLAKSLDMVHLGHISIDGTKVKANASNYSVIKKEDLDEIDRFIREELARGAEEDEREDEIYGPDKTDYELPEDTDKKKIVSKIKERFKKGDDKERRRLSKIIGKARDEIERGKGNLASLTDPESRFMRNSNGRIGLSYNGQITVDSEEGIILANDVVQDSHDSGQLIPQIEQTEEYLGKDLSDIEVSADNGYYSMDNILFLKSKKIDGYIPDEDLATEMKGSTRREGFFLKRMFRYDKNKDFFVCPEGKNLTLSTEYLDKSNGRKVRIYRCGMKVCFECSSRKRCTKSKKGRIVKSYGHETLRLEMAEKMRSEAGRKKYKMRARTVEAPFGDIKQNMGLREFLTRGVTTVKTEFNLACTAHNLKRIWKHIGKKSVLTDMDVNGLLSTLWGFGIFNPIFIIFILLTKILPLQSNTKNHAAKDTFSLISTPCSGDFMAKSDNHVINLGLKTHISGFCQINFSNKLAEQSAKFRF